MLGDIVCLSRGLRHSDTGTVSTDHVFAWYYFRSDLSSDWLDREVLIGLVFVVVLWVISGPNAGPL